MWAGAGQAHGDEGRQARRLDAGGPVAQESGHADLLDVDTKRQHTAAAQLGDVLGQKPQQYFFAQLPLAPRG
jgi:hypothetical protein